jgi:hypothetical protein
MKNHQRLERACRASAAAALAVAGLGVLAAESVAQVQLEMAQGQQLVRPMIAPLVAQDDGAGDAIGDPWWDDVEAARPDAKPQPVAADEAPAAEPADAQAMLRAQVEMFAQNVRQQGLAILRRELSLVRQSCPSLEKQQRAIVLEAGRGAIDRAVDEQMQAAGNGRRRQAKPTDLEAAIRDGLKTSLKANASDAELAAYEGEHGLREERRKAAVVAALVAEVDREAYLDDAEREALAKGLTASYRERWRPAVTALQQGRMFVPDESNLPGLERCVEKALGKERKAQWLTARDEARRLAGGPGMQRGQVQAMQPLGNVEVRAQRLGNGGVRAHLFVAPGGLPAVRRGIRQPAGDELTVEAQEDGAAVEAGPVEEQK